MTVPVPALLAAPVLASVAERVGAPASMPGGRAPLAGRRARRVVAGRDGFSLIEVLVSMFIVSMGILALAGLLQSASRYGKMSELRSTAALMANDLADRIRANPAGAPLGGAGYDLAGTYPTALPAPQAPCNAARTPHCDAGQLARADLYFWLLRMQKMLPAGGAYVRYNRPAPPAGGSVDLWVAWADPVTNAALAPERAATECPPAWAGLGANVRCVYLQVGL